MLFSNKTRRGLPNAYLWSEIRNTNADSVGLSALQYQVPLWGDESSFFDRSKIRDLNDGLYLHGWLSRDFNNDGFADIFLGFATQWEREPVPFLLLIYDKNSGTFKDQSFRIKNNIGQTYNRKSMAADFNNDGILDIIAVSHPERDTCRFSFFDIILSNRDTTWIQKTLRVADRSTGNGYFHGVAVGDIDKDGDIDIVLANQCDPSLGGSLCYVNDGEGNFTSNQVTSIDRGSNFSTHAYTVELGDLNQDSYLDLLYWGDPINRRILYGNGKTTFDSNYQDFDTLEYPYVLDYDIGDFDGDGDFDLLLTTTDYIGWRFVFLENNGKDSFGKVIWENHTNDITQSLKSQGFYLPDYSISNVQLVDLNSDGFLDIINQQAPLSNSNLFSGWILLGDGNWNYTHKKIPFAESPRTLSSAFDKGKVILSWDRVKQSYSTSDGGINKWAIYISDKNWGDRSQVSKPIIVSAKDTKINSESDQFLLEPTSKDMFVRLSPIDSSGIEWPLSAILKITILPPTISSATICDGNTLTINGTNFIGITRLTIGGTDVLSYNVLSDKVLQVVIDSGQSGSVSITTLAGNATSTDITYIVPPSQTFEINGKKSPFKGAIETYSVPVTQGVNFSWEFPKGWEQISGDNSNSVSVKIGIVGGTIKVYPSAICGNLMPISLPVSVYTYIPDDNFQQALRDLGIDKENKPDSVFTSSIVNVSSLSLNSKNISDLTGIQDFSSLKHLECWDNQLNVLDLRGNTVLEELFCSTNRLTSLDLSNNVALNVLRCDGNRLSNLDISKNTSLSTIACGNNPLTSLNVFNNKELVTLSIYFSTVSSIDLSNNSKLNLFHCGFNKFTQLDLSKNLELHEIACDNNQISNLDLSKNTKLTTLICSSNELVSLNLRNGNNNLLRGMYADNNPTLSCINVDNPVLALTYSEWKKDATASYSENCPPVITSISPKSVCRGGTLNITGANFTGVSSINFGGTPAVSFTVISPTNISAVVEDGMSGVVSVTNSLGTATISGFKLFSIPEIAGTITGSTIVNQGQNSVTYAVPSIANTNSYIWTLPDGATGTSSTNSIRVNFSKTAVSGNITVKGHSDCGDGAESNLSIIVNRIPIAIAGSDQSVNEGSTVSLDGSLSSDPDGNLLTYKWTTPSGIILSSTTVAQPTFIAPEIKNDTILILSLIVNDGFINSESSTVKVSVKNVIKTGSEILGMNGVKIFPNPSNGIFKIEGLPINQKNKISVSTIDGKLIKKKLSNSTTETIDLSNQVSGTYLLVINKQTFKILKK
jgi:hypothetical protein